MATEIVVFVADLDGSNRGELTVLEDPRKAERLVETMLEAGVEQERVTVFYAAPLEMEVRQRPVVSLSADAAQASAAEAEGTPEPEGEGAEDGPFVRNGVRFSSLFRPS